VVVDAAQDVDGTYRGWFDDHDVVAVLQRPDFVVYGAAHAPEDVEQMLSSLRAALTDPAHSLADAPAGGSS
jgi:hypothetical protein